MQLNVHNSERCSGLMLTAGRDGTVKYWDIHRYGIYSRSRAACVTDVVVFISTTVWVLKCMKLLCIVASGNFRLLCLKEVSNRRNVMTNYCSV